jgi:hypothetical protein
VDDDLSQLLASLSFQGDAVDRIYLNDPRVLDQFIQHLGSIESVVRSGNFEDGLGFNLKVIQGDRRQGTQTVVTWTLDNPMVQALLLQAALVREGVLRDPADASVGDYILASGVSYLTSGDYEVDFMRDLLNPIEDGLYDLIEAARVQQERWFERLQHEGPGLHTLTLVRETPPRVFVSFLESTWIASVSQWFEESASVLGVLRGVHPFPIISGYHAYHKW